MNHPFEIIIPATQFQDFDREETIEVHISNEDMGKYNLAPEDRCIWSCAQLDGNLKIVSLGQQTGTGRFVGIKKLS